MSYSSKQHNLISSENIAFTDQAAKSGPALNTVPKIAPNTPLLGIPEVTDNERLYAAMPDLSDPHIRLLAKYTGFGSIIIGVNAIVWCFAWLLMDSWLMAALSLSFLHYANIVYQTRRKGLYYKSLALMTLGITFWLSLVVFIGSGSGLGHGGAVHGFFLTMALCLFLSLKKRQPTLRYCASGLMILMFIGFHFPFYEFQPFYDLPVEQHSIATRFTWASVFISFLIILWLKNPRSIYDRKVIMRNPLLDKVLRNLNPYLHFEYLQSSQKFAKAIPECSVLILDISNRLELMNTLDEDLLCEQLNELFGEFDDAVYAMGLTKVDNSDNVYMVTAGVSSFDQKHAENTILLAKRMREIAKRFTHINIRIGIHSGAVMAGFISEPFFTFSVWGKGVDVAHYVQKNYVQKNYVQKHSVQNTIDISETTFQSIKHRFRCEALETNSSTHIPNIYRVVD